MSDVNRALLSWRLQLQQAGLSADDATELESHLVEEMDALQQSGLRPDESFVVATRRLGHPCELAAEYSKNDALMSWRRPARLLLWGLLMLEGTSLVFSLMLLTVYGLGAWDAVGSSLLGGLIWLSHLSNWIALGLLWLLAARSQGAVSRILARLEEWLQTSTGAISLVASAVLLELVNVSVRLGLQSLLTKNMPNPGQEIDFFTFDMFSQLLVGQLAWIIPVVAILIILVRVETPRPVAKLATH